MFGRYDAGTLILTRTLLVRLDMDPEPGPPRRPSLGEELAGRLRQAIVSAELVPGTPLAEPGLAKQFGVSRAPVRDALVQLERERLVEFTGTGRTRVRQLTPQDFEEVVTLRDSLETLGAQRAAIRWTAADTGWVEANIRAQQLAGTLGELNTLDLNLHEYIVATGAHSRLLEAWRTLRPQIEVWLGHMFQLQRKLKIDSRGKTIDAHRELLAAVASGDPELAHRATAEHVRSWSLWVEGAAKRDRSADDTD